MTGDHRGGRRAVRRGAGRHPRVPLRASGRSATPRTRCAAQLGTRVTDPRHPDAVEILPLYARLSAAEQHRVFEPHRHAPGRARDERRRDVADRAGHPVRRRPGTARISRYSKATKVQRLPIEPISQARANQRSGRCGRVAEGIAIRLYSRGGLRARARSSPSRRSCARRSRGHPADDRGRRRGDARRRRAVPVRRPAGRARQCATACSCSPSSGALEQPRARPRAPG